MRRDGGSSLNLVLRARVFPATPHTPQAHMDRYVKEASPPLRRTSRRALLGAVVFGCCLHAQKTSPTGAGQDGSKAPVVRVGAGATRSPPLAAITDGGGREVGH